MKNTRPATEAIMKEKDKKLADRLRDRGWLVFPPERLSSWSLQRSGMELDTWTVRLLPDVMDPCTPVCADPARHAEGGHDV